jgi:hypothetical protein
MNFSSDFVTFKNKVYVVIYIMWWGVLQKLKYAFKKKEDLIEY